MPMSSITNRMITLLACSFGLMISFAVGISFSFNPLISSIVFGVFSLCVHWIVSHLRMTAPGNFFFIMIAAVAACMPFDLQSIPERIGLVGIGTMIACLLALVYSVAVRKKYASPTESIITMALRKTPYVNFIQSLFIGIFMFISLYSGHLLNLQNPYWIPISCIAVMQGATHMHVWQRSIQRILGTFLGLGVCWLLLSYIKEPLAICISILVLQFVVEMLIVRHYGLAIIFVTPMTILLAEAKGVIDDPGALIASRFLDILLGSLIGAFGGWIVHNEHIRNRLARRMRQTRVAMKRKHGDR
jgi:uncharacterized membrane protein YgaE (UPF0421/DUF939 family)